MHSEDSISIWFFIGVSLLVNGLLILGAGLYALVHPLEHPVYDAWLITCRAAAPAGPAPAAVPAPAPPAR